MVNLGPQKSPKSIKAVNAEWTQVMGDAKINDDKIRELLGKQRQYKLPEIHPIPGGVETLLESPHRKELPQLNELGAGGRPSVLVELIEQYPNTYMELICRLTSGQYLKVACAGVGLKYNTVVQWGRRGTADMENGDDTYYSRFVQDCYRAIGQCRGRIEEAVTQIDPKKWLSLGPGKIFGTEWAEKVEEHRNEDDSPLMLTKKKEEDNDGTKLLVLDLTKEAEAEAMAELEKAKVDINN